ncbi:hypothetical protein SYJ56_13780 [Algoriphagus sp. D3-2-R+10]|uniref:hypothetical protein n=1 Tax=Algoriphagus aurantiacus TaxID=3103948 RepID=UPI002B37E5A6|nr:hypothetical protein [Algoriphagus sp. D3-2-R+10]MEB2776387.1 hypothetical protein [Algoriphagus sp. D3-2-R+10]
MNSFSKLIFFFLLVPNYFSLAQENRIIYSPTNNHYSRIEIPTFNGLPKFGVFQQIRFNPGTFQKINVNNNEDGVEINKYFYLLELRYLAEYYKTLDENMPASLKLSSTINVPDNLKIPLFAENHLALVVQALRTTRIENKFFHPWNSDGSPATSIDRVADYKEFLKTEYVDLSAWASTLWANNELIGYRVVEVILGKYNFEGKGYFLSLGENQNAFTLGPRPPINFDIKFKPKSDYNRDVADILTNKGNILFEMSESDAKILEESFSKNNYGDRDRNAYMVLEIRMYRGINDRIEDNSFRYNPKLELLYNVISPLVEVYEDFELTKKIGDIDLEDLIFENE